MPPVDASSFIRKSPGLKSKLRFQWEASSSVLILRIRCALSLLLHAICASRIQGSHFLLTMPLDSPQSLAVSTLSRVHDRLSPQSGVAYGVPGGGLRRGVHLRPDDRLRAAQRERRPARGCHPRRRARYRPLAQNDGPGARRQSRRTLRPARDRPCAPGKMVRSCGSSGERYGCRHRGRSRRIQPRACPTRLATLGEAGDAADQAGRVGRLSHMR